MKFCWKRIVQQQQGDGEVGSTSYANIIQKEKMMPFDLICDSRLNFQCVYLKDVFSLFNSFPYMRKEEVLRLTCLEEEGLFLQRERSWKNLRRIRVLEKSCTQRTYRRSSIFPSKGNSPCLLSFSCSVREKDDLKDKNVAGNVFRRSSLSHTK